MEQEVSRGATLFAVSAAAFMMPFMMTSVSVALPAMGREFDASALQLGLVATSYVLASSIFLLPTGRLGDIHGRRKVFQLGIAVFTLVGAFLTQAWSIEAVIGLRFLQGMGGAMIVSTSLAILVAVFPPAKRGTALGTWVASVYAGMSCGPFIGGALVTSFGWRSLFYLCIVLGVTTYILVAWKFRGEWADARGEPFDWKGSLVYGGAILLLLAGASNLDRSSWAWGLLGAGIAGLGLFGWVETRTRHPILDVDLLRRNRLFALSNVAALLHYAATFGVIFFLSLYLQYVKGMSARTAGAVLAVQPVTQALLSPLCGRLGDRYPPERVATAGMALCAVSLAIAAPISAETSTALLLCMLVLLGMGYALFSSPNIAVTMGSVEPRHLGVASGFSSSMRSLGIMASMTIITVILSVFMGGHAVTPATQPAFVRSVRTGMVSFCALCCLGVLCSLGRLRPGAGSLRGAMPSDDG